MDESTDQWMGPATRLPACDAHPLQTMTEQVAAHFAKLLTGAVFSERGRLALRDCQPFVGGNVTAQVVAFGVLVVAVEGSAGTEHEGCGSWKRNDQEFHEVVSKGQRRLSTPDERDHD